MADAINHAKDRSDITDQKKFEWKMDIIREYDDKRCDKLESFLSTRRNIIESNAKSPGVQHAIGMLKSSGMFGKQFSGSSYYRDKGRQPRA
jgi:hypothetical protein